MLISSNSTMYHLYHQKKPEEVEKFRVATLKGWKYAIENSGEIIDIILNK